MALQQFQIVNADGLGSINYQGVDYPINQIDDTMAEKLYGKTHIIQKVAVPVAAVPATVAQDGDEAAPATKSRSK
jgi:hypothetical protein